MDRLVYLSMAGAKANMQRQDVLANNLANAATPGFRAELSAFRAVPVQGSGASHAAAAAQQRLRAKLRRKTRAASVRVGLRSVIAVRASVSARSTRARIF